MIPGLMTIGFFVAIAAAPRFSSRVERSLALGSHPVSERFPDVRTRAIGEIPLTVTKRSGAA